MSFQKALLVACAIWLLSLLSCMSGNASPQPNPFDTKPSTDTAGLMNPMSSKSDIEAQILRDKIKNSKDTLKAAGRGRTFYVSNNGSDNNKGNSPRNPWATISKVNHHLYRKGDVVLFERGGIFRGQLRTKNNVSYGAYGSGDKPCIYGSVVNYVSIDWNDLGNNIWVCQEKILSDAGIIVFNHGEHAGIKKLSIDSLSENLHYYHNKTDKLVYMYADFGNPSVIFNSIEIGENRNIVQIPGNGENIILENLCIKYGGAHGIGGDGFSNVTVRNCEIGWIGGSIQYGETRFGNGIENWEGSENFTVEQCYIYQIYDAALTHQGNEPSSVKNTVFRNNLIEYCTYSIEYFQEHENGIMSNVIYENNIMRFAGYGWGNQRPDKEESSHIKSWGFSNKAEKFIIRNNILDTSKYYMFEIQSDLGYRNLPVLNGNTFIQYADGKAGYYGDDMQSFNDKNEFFIGYTDGNSKVILY